MKYNHGEFKETQIVEKLNGNKYKELPLNLQNMVRFIFPNCKEDDVIKCKLITETMKPDFSISIGEEIHYVSMKSGINNILHQEYIKNFINLLRSYGFSDYVLKTVLYFQFGDGTLDGSAEERISYEELRLKLKKPFKKSNEELNANRRAVVELVDRFMFKGSHEEYITADYLYHGSVDYGLIVSRTQFLKHLEVHDWSWCEAIHIGPLLFRPHARYYKTKVKNESYRRRVEFYWPNLLPDMEYIRLHYLP